MFMNYRERFDYLKLSDGFEFVSYGNHKVNIKCKKCGCVFSRWDDFIRRSKHGKIKCENCGFICEYEAPEYEKREPKPPYVKKGYHTPEAEAARKRTNEIRRQKADEKYRQMFYELGLDATFDYIGFKKKGYIWFCCKKCGKEMSRNNDIFKGKTKNLHCKECGNGTILYSPFVDELLKFYSEGHSVKETAEKFNVSIHRVNCWAKVRKVSNGRTASEICSEIGKKGAQIRAKQQMKEAEIRFRQVMSEQGFRLISKYKGKNTSVVLECVKCGEQFSRYVSRARQGVCCSMCTKVEKTQKLQAQQEQKLAEKRLKEAQKAANQALFEAERNKRLDELHTCKVCGGSYSIRSYMKSIGTKYERDSGYCSAKCRNKSKNQREHARRKIVGGDSHRKRARKFGCEFDSSVTLKRLIERDGLYCKICGMACNPDDHGWTQYMGPTSPTIDHIIPMAQGGGHTWNNVQIAHAQCNSWKSDKKKEGGKYETNEKSHRARIRSNNTSRRSA